MRIAALLLALAAASRASQTWTACRFVFGATAGGDYSNLGEVRFYDAAGQLLEGVVASASNPGGSSRSNNYAPSKIFDALLTKCWNDQNGGGASGLASTLELTFEKAVTFAAYDLVTGANDGSCPTDGYPTAWQLLCTANASSGEWAVVDTRTDVAAPTTTRTSYSQVDFAAGFPVVGPASEYPARSADLAAAAGSNVSVCRFVFGATAGGDFTNVRRFRPRTVDYQSS